jgi:hypothetical protein
MEANSEATCAGSSSSRSRSVSGQNKTWDSCDPDRLNVGFISNPTPAGVKRRFERQNSSERGVGPPSQTAEHCPNQAPSQPGYRFEDHRHHRLGYPSALKLAHQRHRRHAWVSRRLHLQKGAVAQVSVQWMSGPIVRRTREAVARLGRTLRPVSRRPTLLLHTWFGRGVRSRVYRGCATRCPDGRPVGLDVLSLQATQIVTESHPLS